MTYGIIAHEAPLFQCYIWMSDCSAYSSSDGVYVVCSMQCINRSPETVVARRVVDNSQVKLITVCTNESPPDWCCCFVDVQGFKHYSFPVVPVNFTCLGGIRVLFPLGVG